MPPDVILRPATAADLPAINDIYYHSQMEGVPNPPPQRALTSYPHLLATGTLYVAERRGTVLAFAGSVERSGIVFLTDLFVRPEERSKGLGKALLERVLPHDGRTLSTVASGDPRAISRYVRTGMRPLYPVLFLRAGRDEIGALPTAGIDVGEAEADDPELARWDGEIGGRYRPQEIAFWVREHRAVPLWFRRDGEAVGYGIVHRFSGNSPWLPESITVGPVGARTEADAAGCVAAAVAWAQPQSPMVRLFVVGPHPALAMLLDAGFRIGVIETFCCSTPSGFFDPCRYLPSGDDLL